MGKLERLWAFCTAVGGVTFRLAVLLLRQFELDFLALNTLFPVADAFRVEGIGPDIAR